MLLPPDRRISFVDAFAGCGGLSLGLLLAGCDGLFAIERDKFAFETLKHNLLDSNAAVRFSWPTWLPKKPISIDAMISRYERHLRSMSGEVDLLVGGPPCQGFSSAGKRQHDDPRNRLFKSYVRLVDMLAPKIVLMENVRGFTTSFSVNKRTKNYANRLRELLSSRYVVYEDLLQLTQFGVPQARTRYFLIALQPGLTDRNPFAALQETLPGFLRNLGLLVPVSSGSAISDLSLRRKGSRPSQESRGFEEIAYAGPLTRYQKLMNGGRKELTDLRMARHAPEIAERFEEIIELSHSHGRLNVSLSADLRERFGLKKKALRVLDPGMPSPTVTSMPDDLLHYSDPRTLTVRENARLQSFPDWFEFKGKYTTGGELRRREVPRFTQVANAVPPLAAQAIGTMLATLLRDAPARRRVTSSSNEAAQISEVASKSKDRTP